MFHLYLVVLYLSLPLNSSAATAVTRADVVVLFIASIDANVLFNLDLERLPSIAVEGPNGVVLFTHNQGHTAGNVFFLPPSRMPRESSDPKRRTVCKDGWTQESQSGPFPDDQKGGEPYIYM